MTQKKLKKSIFIRIRNNFFAGAVVLIPLGITLYLSLFFIKFSTKIIPKEIDWVLRIDGHTDKRPIFNNNFQSNWHLSSSRAIKIVNFLISQGIPPSRLVAAGFGEYHPITDDDSEQAYKENRRIEIKLTNR